MNSAAPLTYITTCKGRLEHLKVSLPRVASQPNIHCVVVDFDCPDGTAAWVSANFPQVDVVKLANRPDFNPSVARNLGARAARSPWLGFFDADVLPGPDLHKLIPLLQPGYYYRAHPVTHQTWGSIICGHADFWNAGGYDEAYVGWGGEDDDLLANLRSLGIRPAGFPAGLLTEIAHDEASRMRYFEIRNRWQQSRINQTYLQAKTDLKQLLGQRLSPGDATAVFGEITRQFLLGDSRHSASSISVNLQPITIGSPPQEGVVQISQIARSINYTVAVVGEMNAPGIPVPSVPVIDPEHAPTMDQVHFTLPQGGGFVLHVPRNPSTAHVLREVVDHACYEPAPMRRSVDVVVDVGANAGIAAAFFRQRFPHARIHCFEPDPGAIALLTKNAEALGDCQIHPFGLSDRDETALLYSGREGTPTSSLIPNSCTMASGSEVRLRNARLAFAELGLDSRIDLLKLDTEGCELPVLDALRSHIPEVGQILVEFHSEDDRRRIDELLRPTHTLWRATVHSPHRGLLNYVARSLAIADPVYQPLVRGESAVQPLPQ